MSPTQLQTTPAPLSPDIYSESIEQQFAIVHDFLLTPVGAALLATDPWVRRQLSFGEPNKRGHVRLTRSATKARRSVAGLTSGSAQR